MLDEVKVKRVFFERPQAVFRLAGFFVNQNSVDHPERDLMVNGMGTLRTLECSVLAFIERFVLSSNAAYGPQPVAAVDCIKGIGLDSLVRFARFSCITAYGWTVAVRPSQSRTVVRKLQRCLVENESRLK